MPVPTDLQNPGDAQLCREMVAGTWHLLAEKRGAWPVSIAGSGQRELGDANRGIKSL